MDNVSEVAADWFVPGKEQALPTPRYLSRHYWWAYVHPWAVKFWDHLPIVNMILLGNYGRLRGAALAEFEGIKGAKVLQIAAVYGDLSPKVGECVVAGDGRYDIADVLPIQLNNVKRKFSNLKGVRFLNRNSEHLGLASATYDRVMIFLLLHEQPPEARARTLAEAFRVLKPGGEFMLVEFAKPYRWNPFRYLWRVFLAIFEPFALGMWWTDVQDMIPAYARAWPIRRERFFGGLFQKVVISAPKN